MFAIIFGISRMVKVAKKINNDRYFETEGVEFKVLFCKAFSLASDD
jgi:hypothetical protein